VIEGSLDVDDGEGDVVQALAVPRQEPTHGRLRGQRSWMKDPPTGIIASSTPWDSTVSR
jgi:hypothetical protein